MLSGGEKTRLALATLVVSSANVLLLDEPTNNLDPASRAQVLDAIGNFGGAIVLVTHDEGAVHALDPIVCWSCPMAPKICGVLITPN
ncbi:ABC transporter ATP-binding protein [Cutibacterium acnes JCM 18909]|nr:ABC transporter ATP-binding protein [Cutibacterium acnes JCM 18909]